MSQLNCVGSASVCWMQKMVDLMSIAALFSLCEIRRGLLAEEASCFLRRVLQMGDECAKGNRLRSVLCQRVCSAVALITKGDASLFSVGWGTPDPSRLLSEEKAPVERGESTWRSAEDP